MQVTSAFRRSAVSGRAKGSRFTNPPNRCHQCLSAECCLRTRSTCFEPAARTGCHQCLSAECCLRTQSLPIHFFNFVRHQCLSAECCLRTRFCRNEASGGHAVTSAFRRSAVSGQIRSVDEVMGELQEVTSAFRRSAVSGLSSLNALTVNIVSSAQVGSLSFALIDCLFVDLCSGLK